MLLTITGNVPSQKNGKEIAINRKTGQRFIRSNDRVKSWQDAAIQELKLQFMGYRIKDYPISIGLTFYFDNARRHDLDNAASGVMDALVKAEILPDDNVSYVDRLHLRYGGIDKISPRAEIYLED